MNPGLDALIYPRSSAELLANDAAGEPFVVHGRKDSITALTELPHLASLDWLLRSWPDQVQAYLPDVADEASSILTSPHDARKLFANGSGLLFNDVNTVAPQLVAWLDGIRRDLGLSSLTQGRCLIYATPKGKGTAPHFDQNLNLVLQLHGTKTWWLAPNRHVERPMTRYTMGLPMDPEMQTYATTPMPRTMPADRLAIVLEPGSVLFVPRGVWHSTDASEDAVSLNFTYSAPTWIDLLTAALRSRLALSSAWRETAAPRSPAIFAELLRELADDASHWTATDILTATEDDPQA